MSIDNFGGSAVKINSSKVIELKKEAQRRIKGYLSSHNNKLPKFNILPAEKDKYLIYVDMDSQGFLYLKIIKENITIYQIIMFLLVKMVTEKGLKEIKKPHMEHTFFKKK